MINNNIELLAPAGSMEALKAAVYNGCNAVYLGGYKFGARHYASNFSIEELKEGIEFCHIHNVRVYVTANTLIHNREVKDFLEYMDTLYYLDVDGVIVQDIGMINLIRNRIPNLEVHSSTQLTIHNTEGVEMLKDMGLTRAVLAREMDIDEIRDIKAKSDMELEVFIHGALCMCYSGQCLMSSLIGGRSGNRGKCAQPCRLKYDFINLENNKKINEIPTYLLSPKDLNTVNHVEELVDARIDSLKLEGRMKKPEYVATVVGAYRQALDKVLYGEQFNNKLAMENLTQIFNRGFTEGYLFKTDTLTDFKKPGNRGRKIGQIVGFNKKRRRVKVKLEGQLNKGDGIAFVLSNSKQDSDMGTVAQDIYVDGVLTNKANISDIAEVPYKSELTNGMVYKTMDKELLIQAKDTYVNSDKRIDIHSQITGYIGDTLKMYLWDDDGNNVYIEGEYIIEEARNRPLDEERLKKQLSKLGDTQYRMMNVSIDINDNIAVPIGEVNKIRRYAVSKLNALRGNRNKRVTLKKNSFAFKKVKKDEGTELICSVESIDGLQAVLQTNVNQVYFKDIYSLDKAMSLTKERDIKLIPALSRISGDAELEDILAELKKLGIEEVLVGNLGQFYRLNKEGLRVNTDFGINIFNSPTVDALGSMGASRVTLSPELNSGEIKDISKTSNLPLELIGYGRSEMMITKYCPKKELVGCKGCNNEEKNYKYGLVDRKKAVFPIKMDDKCRTIILNSKTTVLIDSLCEINENNINFLRLEFTNESKDEIIDIVNAYSAYIDNIDSIKVRKNIADGLIDRFKKDDNYTKGHYHRGVD